MPDLLSLAARVEALTGPDRDLDWEIAEARGGQIRRVSRLGLSGRSPGSYRVFWPTTRVPGPGNSIPTYTKTPETRKRAAAALRAKAAQQQMEADRG